MNQPDMSPDEPNVSPDQPDVNPDTRLEDLTEYELHPCFKYDECGKAGIYGGYPQGWEGKTGACPEHKHLLKPEKWTTTEIEWTIVQIESEAIGSFNWPIWDYVFLTDENNVHFMSRDQGKTWHKQGLLSRWYYRLCCYLAVKVNDRLQKGKYGRK